MSMNHIEKLKILVEAHKFDRRKFYKSEICICFKRFWPSSFYSTNNCRDYQHNNWNNGDNYNNDDNRRKNIKSTSFTHVLLLLFSVYGFLQFSTHSPSVKFSCLPPSVLLQVAHAVGRLDVQVLHTGLHAGGSIRYWVKIASFRASTDRFKSSPIK